MTHFPPIGEQEGKKAEIEAMFNGIAPRYDLLNRVLSFGSDVRWRRKAIDLLRARQPRRILDVATGTGDLAIQALDLNPEKVVGVDIAEEMLEVGRRKVTRMGLDARVTLQTGDAERLPFSDNQFDAALVAFGVRNFENLKGGLSEIRRVLRKGSGTLVVLEFSQPKVFPIKQVYGFYGRYILPRIGGAISGDRGAYQYLPDSIAAFPAGQDFLDVMADVGYANLSCTPLTFGVASLYQGDV